MVLTSFSSQNDRAYSAALQNDGKIVVVGYTEQGVTGKDILVLRYHTDGRPDSSFGFDGNVFVDVNTGSDDIAYSVAIQPDGKIVVAGSSDDGTDKDAVIVRLTPEGFLDADFNNSGIVLTDFENNQQDEVRVIRLHPLTGKMILGGNSQVSTNIAKPVVARFDSTGKLDTSFNHTGIRLLWVTSLDYQYYFSLEDLVLQSNGKISVAGWRDFPSMSWDSDYWLGRINSDGSMDNSFSTDGVVVINGNFNGHDRAYSLWLKPDNSVIFAGGSYRYTLRYDFLLAQLTSSGNGILQSNVADFGSLKNDVAYGLAIDGSGRYLLGGSSEEGSNSDFVLARFFSDFIIDSTFGSYGRLKLNFGNGTENACRELLIQNDQKILAVGYSGNAVAIARLLPEASPLLDSFRLLNPAQQVYGIDFNQVNFDWTDAFLASSYTLYCDTDSTFATNPVVKTSGPSQNFINALTPNTTYYWRVRASDGTNFGNYSPTWNFTTASLDSFLLLLPANQATGVNFNAVDFDWTDATGADEYLIEIDSSSDFSTNPLSFSPTLSEQKVLNLAPNTTYYWRVKAQSGIHSGNYIGPWIFTTLGPNGVRVPGKLSLRLYPNPANERLYLETSLTESQGYTVSDVTGRTVLQGKWQPGKGLDISALPAGVYWISLPESGATGRFMKQGK